MSIFDKYDLIDVDESFPIPTRPESGLHLILGSSGSGKTTILRNWFGKADVLFSQDCIYRDFSSPEAAERLLIACGLRSIPAWRRPYSTLSNGEKHRVYCARSLDLGIPFLDEFTSVVDRETAKSLSYSLQKHYRRSGMKCLVVASCHRDIEDWLNPDSVTILIYMNGGNDKHGGHFTGQESLFPLKPVTGKSFGNYFANITI